MDLRRTTRLRRATAIAVIAAMLSFAQTCALHAGLCRAEAAVDAECLRHAAGAQAAAAGHDAATDDDCCGSGETHAAPRTLTCCSTWGAAETNYELRAPAMLACAAVPPIATPRSHWPVVSAIEPQWSALAHAGAPPPRASILRL